MQLRSIRRSSVALGAALGLTWLLTGCGGDFIPNNIAVRDGDVRVRFINSTRFRAAFTFGSYDPLDRVRGVGPIFQLRLENNQVSEEFEVACRRATSVGGSEFIRRATESREDINADDFDADAFTEGVNFSSAPADSPAAALPTRGTAVGIERLLGVDYSCEDVLIFTFVESIEAPGGFRIDFQVLRDTLEGRTGEGVGGGLSPGGGGR